MPWSKQSNQHPGFGMEDHTDQQILERFTRLRIQGHEEPGPAFWRIMAVVTQGRAPAETTPEPANDRSQLDALAARWVAGEFTNREVSVELDTQFRNFFPEFRKLLRQQTLDGDEQERFDHLTDLVVVYGSLQDALLHHMEHSPITPEQTSEATAELEQRLGVRLGKPPDDGRSR